MYINNLGEGGVDKPYQLEKKLGSFIKRNKNFRTLDAENLRKIKSMPKKYATHLRGGKITDYIIKRDVSKLKTEIDKKDLKRMTDIIEEFKT